ncbi:MAG TPA: radical SAM protein [Candidatus Woesebacteria bacterium]|nr:radical SAM protein [Candidatus Woesebacteria bacterium]
MKKFLSLNFGCRVNSAEINQLSQSFIDQGFIPSKDQPDIILVNTCAITKKGEYESISKIKKLLIDYPKATIIATGCADLSKITPTKNFQIYDKKNLPEKYTHQIKDKFSHTNRYILRVQTGCTSFCSYCIVPTKRTTLWSMPLDQAVSLTNQAIQDGYQEIIITGINLNQYTPGLSNLVEALLTQTKISLISFGSLPLLCIDDKLIDLFKNFEFRIKNFVHIPLQSGSDKILKLMNRPYNQQKIISIIKNFKFQIKNLSLGTDIIVGFPNETESDFQETYNLCQSIGFQKIHVFRYSPRPQTKAKEIFLNSPKISKEIIKARSQKLRSLNGQTTLPSHQTPEN